MKSAHPRTSMLLPALFLAFSASAHEGEDHAPAGKAALSPDAQAVVATLESYAGAISGKALARVKPLFASDDFTYFEGTFVNRGWQSYYDHMAPEMALFEKPLYRMTDIEPFVSGDLAYATFSWAMDVTVVSEQFKGGRHPVSMKGKGTAVLGQTDGKWKIRHLHTAQAPAKKPADSSQPH